MPPKSELGSRLLSMHKIPTKKLIWISSDELVSVSMGGYSTEQQALEAVPARLAALLSFCASEEARRFMQKGTWRIL